jgi:arylformamidase
MRRTLDITPPITAALAVCPGDSPPRREILLDLSKGDSITLSTLHATVHLGAHADGANHFGLDAPGIEARPLEDFLGPCQVVRVEVPRRGRIRPEDLTVPITEPRVLLATGTFPDPNTFREDFAALAPELVDHLQGLGVRTIGIDTPSVDPFDSKELPAHGRFLALGMAILEGLVLAHVPEGRYELIALPLPLVGFDASPVRAILRTLE